MTRLAGILRDSASVSSRLMFILGSLTYTRAKRIRVVRLQNCVVACSLSFLVQVCVAQIVRAFLPLNALTARLHTP